MEERVCLVVDDDSVIRSYLKTVLERNGWRCLEAGNAPDARRMIESLHGEVHLILSDVDMPGEMNGIGLAVWVRDTYPAIRIVLVTGSGESTPPEFPLVSKPCKPETVLRAVEGMSRKAS